MRKWVFSGPTKEKKSLNRVQTFFFLQKCQHGYKKNPYFSADFKMAHFTFVSSSYQKIEIEDCSAPTPFLGQDHGADS
jgi:hypothetical protein